MDSIGGFECENCKRQCLREATTCPHCGFPTEGTEDEKNLFYHNLETARVQLMGMEEKVYHAKLCLWVIGGVNFLYSLLYYMFQSETEDAFFVLLLNLAVSIIFVILAISANEKPHSALIGGLVIYLALIVYRIIDSQSGIPFISLLPYGFVVWIAIGISNTSQVEYLKKEVRRRTGQK